MPRRGFSGLPGRQPGRRENPGNYVARSHVAIPTDEYRKLLIAVEALKEKEKYAGWSAVRAIQHGVHLFNEKYKDLIEEYEETFRKEFPPEEFPNYYKDELSEEEYNRLVEELEAKKGKKKS